MNVYNLKNYPYLTKELFLALIVNIHMDIKDSPDIVKIYLVKVDMRLLRHFADYVLENGEENYINLSQSIKNALKIALVVCYSRPFFEKYETTVDENISITKFLTKNFLDEEIVLHKNILEMYAKDIGNTKINIPSIEDIESNITHISLSKSNSKPVSYNIIQTLRVMAKKIYTNAEVLVEGTPDLR